MWLVFFYVWQCRTCYHGVKTWGYRRRSVLVANLWTVSGWFPQKLQMPVNVSGKLKGTLLWMARKRNDGCWGKGSSSGACMWISVQRCWLLGNLENLAVEGPSHLVSLKLMPQVMLGAGCVFNPALPHSRVMGPWDNLCIAQVTPPSGSHPFSAYFESEQLCAGCERDGLQPWETSLGI